MGFPWQAGASVVGTAGGYFAQRQANKANIAMQQKQLDWNKNMWHMQNEYNSPEAQMQRFREAGLNTHLMYGQGQSGNAQGPAEGVAPPNIQPTLPAQGGGEAISNYIKLKTVDAQVENIKADTAVKLGQKDKVAMESAGISINNKRDYLSYMKETNTYGNYLKRDQIETAAAGLELVKLGLENERSAVALESETINLAWQQFEKILNAAQSIEDLRGTELANQITSQELAYIKKWNIKMGTENPMVGAFKDFMEDNNNILLESKKGYNNWVVRRGARSAGKGKDQRPEKVAARKNRELVSKDKKYWMNLEYQNSKWSKY